MFEKKNTQKIIAFALGYLISFPAISYAITNLAAFWSIPVISSLATPVLYASFYATLILAMLHTMKKTSVSRLAVMTFMAVSFLWAWFSDRGNSLYMWTSCTDLLNNPTYTFWFFSFYAFILSDYIRDTVVFARTLEKFSYVSVVLALMQYLTALYRGVTPEYMTFSYNILFATAYLIILHLNQPNWRRLAVGAVGAVLILFAGCRGALIGLIFSLVVALVHNLGCTSRKRMKTIIVLIVISVVFMLFWQNILEDLVLLLDKLGIESRNVDKIVSESFLEDSGRSALIEVGLANIDILGLGLYGDRVLLRGSYVHNIAIEVYLAYGIFTGTIIFAMLVAVLVKGLYRAELQRKMMICALLSVGVVKLFFSGSFLNKEAGLYLLIGLCVNSIREAGYTNREG